MLLELPDGTVQKPHLPQTAPLGVSPLCAPSSALSRPFCTLLASVGFLLKNSQSNKLEKNVSDSHLGRREEGAPDRDYGDFGTNPAFGPVSAAHRLCALEPSIFPSPGLPVRGDAQKMLAGVNWVSLRQGWWRGGRGQASLPTPYTSIPPVRGASLIVLSRVSVPLPAFIHRDGRHDVHHPVLYMRPSWLRGSMAARVPTLPVVRR